MARQEFVTQTVGAAVDGEWKYLRVVGQRCHRRVRVDLTRPPRQERLAETARKLRCQRCRATIGSDYLAFSLIAEWVSTREKPIGFSGMMAVKIGMS